MTIAAILSGKGRDVATVASGTCLAAAAATLAEKRIGALPVVGDHGEILGIFSERDFVGCVSAYGAAALDMAVDRAMSAPAVTITLDMPVLAALSTMTQRRIRHLPVVEGGEIRGIVSIGDLVKHRIERIEAEAEALRDYIRQA